MPDPMIVTDADGSASLSAAHTEIERLRSCLVEAGRMVGRLEVHPLERADKVELVQFCSDNILPPQKAGDPSP